MTAAAQIILVCLSLSAVDGDTVKCDGVNMRMLGGGVPFVSGVDTPEIGSHAKCIKERKLGLIAKARLKELLNTKPIQVISSGTVDKTPKRRPLVNIYLPNGEEIGQKMVKEGIARIWKPNHKNDWCN